MSPFETNNEQQTREDRATQPMEAGRLSFAIYDIILILYILMYVSIILYNQFLCIASQT